jgi:23S rRNA (adenine2030-N6)-methyltransferase
MNSYDHRAHAGNAGDVWKHFLLMEAADHCLRNGLNYVESHVGRPAYALGASGEWKDGIGRCWRLLPDLQKFLYFRILADLNCQGLKRYPGSARLVLEASRMKGQELSADIWDIDPGVASSWGEAPKTRFREVTFHREDGFSGVLALLDRSAGGLLLVDPPHLDPQNSAQAERLLSEAEDKGWVALLWEMMGECTSTGCSFEKYELEFEQAGLSCGKWRGAIVSMAGDDVALRQRLKRSIEEFLEILKLKEPFNSKGNDVAWR